MKIVAKTVDDIDKIVEQLQNSGTKKYDVQRSGNLVKVVQDEDTRVWYVSHEMNNARMLFAHIDCDILDLQGLDTSEFSTMHGMFLDATVETGISLLDKDTSNVRDMSEMFEGCKTLLMNLSGIDTSFVSNMGDMFRNCQAPGLDLSSFDTSHVESMHGMFMNYFAGPINLSSFDTGEVRDMSYMFYNCRCYDLDLASFDFSKVLRYEGMFERCECQFIDLTKSKTGTDLFMDAVDGDVVVANAFLDCDAEVRLSKNLQYIEGYLWRQSKDIKTIIV